MQARDGLTSAVAIPSEVSLQWKGTPVTITLDTEYPFRNRFRYTVTAEKKTSMKLRVRVPSFAKKLTVNGKEMQRRPYLVFNGFEAGQTVIEISFEAEPTLVARPHGLYHVQCGSLLFALPIKRETKAVEYIKNGVERKAPYCDYHIKGISDWNYGFASRVLTVQDTEISDVPFSSEQPPVTVKAELCHIDWDYADGYDQVCAPIPNSRKALDEAQPLTLYPYGCAKLRMTEMPIIK